MAILMVERKDGRKFYVGSNAGKSAFIVSGVYSQTPFSGDFKARVLQLIDRFEPKKFMACFLDKKRIQFIPQGTGIDLEKPNFERLDLVVEGSYKFDPQSLSIQFELHTLHALHWNPNKGEELLPLWNPNKGDTLLLPSVIDEINERIKMVDIAWDSLREVRHLGQLIESFERICVILRGQTWEKDWLDKMNTLLSVSKEKEKLNLGLAFGVATGNVNMVHSALKAGASLDELPKEFLGKYTGIPDSANQFPWSRLELLAAAVLGRHPEIVELLRKYQVGGQPNGKFEFNKVWHESYLRYALRENLAIAGHLIATGANVNERITADIRLLNSTGTHQITPLLYTVANHHWNKGYADLAIQLLEKGADPNWAEEKTGLRALDLAIRNDDPRVVKALVQKIGQKDMARLYPGLTGFLVLERPKPVPKGESSRFFKMVSNQESNAMDAKTLRTELDKFSDPQALLPKIRSNITTLYAAGREIRKISKQKKDTLVPVSKPGVFAQPVVTINLETAVRQLVMSMEKDESLRGSALLAKLDEFPPPFYGQMQEILSGLSSSVIPVIQEAIELKAAEPQSSASSSSTLVGQV